MQIAGYLKTSLIEWEGKITSVIFTRGCNFRCGFCHNKDLVVRNKEIKKLRYEEEEIFADLESRKKWIDAVVLTGGEPTLENDLQGFLKRLKEMGFLTMIHTNGTSPKAIKGLIINGLTDYICMDLKGDFENYDKYTGIEKSKIKNQNENLKLKIKDSIKLIINSGVEYEFRTTVVPGLHTKENLVDLANDVRKIFENCKLEIENCHWYLQQFSPKNCLDKRYLKVRPFFPEEMKFFQKELQKIIPKTFLRGV